MNNKTSTFKASFLAVATIGIMGVVLFTAQAPVGTVRKSVMTDGSGNVINTPVTASNQWSMVPAPTLPFHLLRLADLTNALSTNLHPFAVTNIVAGTNIVVTGQGTRVYTVAFTNQSLYETKTLTNGLASTSITNGLASASNLPVATNVVMGADVGTGTVYTNLVSCVSPKTSGYVVIVGQALLRCNNLANPTDIGYRILVINGAATNVNAENYLTTPTTSGNAQTTVIRGFDSGLSGARTYILQGRVGSGTGDAWTSTNASFGAATFTATNATALTIIQFP